MRFRFVFSWLSSIFQIQLRFDFVLKIGSNSSGVKQIKASQFVRENGITQKFLILILGRQNVHEYTIDHKLGTIGIPDYECPF